MKLTHVTIFNLAEDAGLEDPRVTARKKRDGSVVHVLKVGPPKKRWELEIGRNSTIEQVQQAIALVKDEQSARSRA